jgi:hypothetical protein
MAKARQDKAKYIVAARVSRFSRQSPVKRTSLSIVFLAPQDKANHGGHVILRVVFIPEGTQQEAKNILHLTEGLPTPPAAAVL